MEFYINAQVQRFNLRRSEIDTAYYHDAALRLGMSDSVILVLYMRGSCGGECMLGDITSGASKQTINSALRKPEQEPVHWSYFPNTAARRKQNIRRQSNSVILFSHT